jgi:hypothetical protein
MLPSNILGGFFMGDHTFRQFLDTFLDAWKHSSITAMEKLISNDYQAREITGGEVIDFGYEESINGWKEGFDFVKEKQAQWEINEISFIPLRENEILAIISATIIIQGKTMETANLFFDTFQKCNNDWKLVRSYIEAGVSVANINKIQSKTF